MMVRTAAALVRSSDGNGLSRDGRGLRAELLQGTAWFGIPSMVREMRSMMVNEAAGSEKNDAETVAGLWVCVNIDGYGLIVFVDGKGADYGGVGDPREAAG
ncbi:hypothetical protein M0R45_025028 [Rubus argutus]|uniref:Uncharacterized protein n=1 Tax=Rubus argutus TaxID=59490 RepID=A0AAW1WTB2_RUBAR